MTDPHDDKIDPGDTDEGSSMVADAASAAGESVAGAADDAAETLRDVPDPEPQPIHPHPAYEDYAAPDSNIVPRVIAAILGGVIVGWLILRRRRRD